MPYFPFLPCLHCDWQIRSRPSSEVSALVLSLVPRGKAVHIQCSSKFSFSFLFSLSKCLIIGLTQTESRLTNGRDHIPTSLDSYTVCLRKSLPFSEAAKPHSRCLPKQAGEPGLHIRVLALTRKTDPMSTAPYFPGMPYTSTSLDLLYAPPWNPSAKTGVVITIWNLITTLPFHLPPFSFILPSFHLSSRQTLCLLSFRHTEHSQSRYKTPSQPCHSSDTRALWMWGICYLPWFQSTIYSWYPHGCGRIKTLLSRERKTDPSIHKSKSCRVPTLGSVLRFFSPKM